MSAHTYVSVNLRLPERIGLPTVFTQADAYDRFMGRYSVLLAAQMADLAGVARGLSGLRVLDVGCGPGALTAELTKRVGADSVAAVDPSEQFVIAVAKRHPGVDVRVASAESLPFADRSFDAAVAQLVVHFMRDPVAGLSEMRRVTRAGGLVAACVWDEEQNPASSFWAAVREVDPGFERQTDRPGTREGHLAQLFAAAGLRDIKSTSVRARLEHATFESWWQPFELGVGPTGVYLAGVDEARRAAVRERARALMPKAPFTHDVRAWAARGVA
jgi:ubiquinone/menaquinone biosynthesis C-methylase UbiE